MDVTLKGALNDVAEWDGSGGEKEEEFEVEPIASKKLHRGNPAIVFGAMDVLLGCASELAS